MKIVLACEGQCEVTLMQSLINKKQLEFKNEILLLEPLKIRQLKEIKSYINLLPINEEIIVFRIGDTLTDELSFKDFELREEYIKSYKICTKSEIEILIIINEGLYDEYLKNKSNMMPKEFIKGRIKKYDFDDYVKSHDLLKSIKIYKKLKGKAHKKDEYTLFDLIDDFSKIY